MVNYVYYSDAGGRKANEDTVAFLLTDQGFCALAADGLGGHGNGDAASQTAVKAISEAFQAHPSCAPQDIQVYFSLANRSVLALNSGGSHAMTTMVGLFCHDGKIAYAHVGDSRLYHFYNGLIVDRTIDHSVSQIAAVLGEITVEQIRNHPDRNRVLKAIGSEPAITAEIHPLTVRKGFHAFLLCSDGFWEYVFEDEMEIDLAKSENPQQWMDYLLRRRTGRAPADADNHSAVFVFLECD